MVKIMMEKLLIERRTTICYREKDIFRKYYKYASEKEILREAYFSDLAYKSGVLTPKHIQSGYSEKRCMYFNDFEYREIIPIDKNLIDEEQCLVVRDLLLNIPRINDIVFWKRMYMPSLLQSISYLAEITQNEINYIYGILNKEREMTFIHGDFSFENIGWDKCQKKYIVYDFQCSGMGIAEWDYAYMLATLSPLLVSKMDLNEETVDLIKVATAVKYGRGIKKKFEVSERRNNYEYWWHK